MLPRDTQIGNQEAREFEHRVIGSDLSSELNHHVMWPLLPGIFSQMPHLPAGRPRWWDVCLESPSYTWAALSWK